MSLWHFVPSVFVLAALSASAPAEEPLVCRINALSSSARQRHQLLGEKLRSAVVEQIELANGYALVLDLARLPADPKGLPFCLVEVAEWVDLEARCCPFLDFGIDLQGKGGRLTLRLTGGRAVKAFLKAELGLLR